MPKVKARRGVRDLNLGGLSVEAEGPRGSLHRRWRNPEDLRVAIGWLGTLGTKGRLMRTGRAEGKLEGWGGGCPSTLQSVTLATLASVGVTFFSRRLPCMTQSIATTAGIITLIDKSRCLGDPLPSTSRHVLVPTS